jgi:N-acyl-D-amino-acid deacylase
MLDIKIVGANIADGPSRQCYSGDVGIQDSKIVVMGKVDGAAPTLIDTAGKIVAPGFIDIHTPYDAQGFWVRMLSVSPWYGVTTALIGNCGFGIAPTRPVDREIIVQSLERVEGMDPESLRQGTGETGAATVIAFSLP